VRVKRIVLVLRRGGFFYFEGRRIEAARPGEGWGVMVILEPSQIDQDFGRPVWVPSQDEIEAIQRALKRSDELTHELRGRGWAGRRPYWRVEDFM